MPIRGEKSREHCNTLNFLLHKIFFLIHNMQYKTVSSLSLKKKKKLTFTFIAAQKAKSITYRQTSGLSGAFRFLLSPSWGRKTLSSSSLGMRTRPRYLQEKNILWQNLFNFRNTCFKLAIIMHSYCIRWYLILSQLFL